MSLFDGQQAEGNTVDLSLSHNRKMIADRIRSDIEAYCQTAYDDGHRNHLGASLIGDPCSRKLWYVFRWVKHVVHTGRMQRLFNRGKREETRFIEWMRGIGFEVWETTEDGKQYRVSDIMGHYGGSLDGICKPPARYNLGEQCVFLAEFKTNGTGAGFEKLKEKGIAFAKPQHFAQMSVYGEDYKFPFGVYFNINKNDDDLYVEIVSLDFSLAQMLKRKADDVIRSPIAPPKFSNSPTCFECKTCDFHRVCHYNEAIEQNCRSCKHAVPIDGAAWACKLWNNVIPPDFVAKGCGIGWQDITK